jgi:hypothetical protein
MSRLVCKHKNGNEVAFGLDHVVGWFYQEFNLVNDCVVDLDHFTMLSRGELIQRLSHTDASDIAITKIRNNLDPGKEFPCC